MDNQTRNLKHAATAVAVVLLMVMALPLGAAMLMRNDAVDPAPPPVTQEQWWGGHATATSTGTDLTVWYDPARTRDGANLVAGTPGASDVAAALDLSTTQVGWLESTSDFTTKVTTSATQTAGQTTAQLDIYPVTGSDPKVGGWFLALDRTNVRTPAGGNGATQTAWATDTSGEFIKVSVENLLGLESCAYGALTVTDLARVDSTRAGVKVFSQGNEQFKPASGKDFRSERIKVEVSIPAPTTAGVCQFLTHVQFKLRFAFEYDGPTPDATNAVAAAEFLDAVRTPHPASAVLELRRTFDESPKPWTVAETIVYAPVIPIHWLCKSQTADAVCAADNLRVAPNTGIDSGAWQSFSLNGYWITFTTALSGAPTGTAVFVPRQGSLSTATSPILTLDSNGNVVNWPG